MKRLHFYKHQFVTVDRTLELYFQGCTIRCNGCQNSELWEKDSSHLVEVEDILDQIKDYVPIARVIHILGGEPMNQDYGTMTILLQKIRKMFSAKVPIYFFTGYTFTDEEVHDFYRFPQFRYVNAVKVGNYKEDELNINKAIDPVLGIALASLNQKGLKV